MGSMSMRRRIATRCSEGVMLIRTHPVPAASVLVTFLGLLYAVSLFIGLRHMNSDDNGYQLRAVRFFSQQITPEVVFDTMTVKIRLRIFNTFIENGMGALQESPWYDVLNLSSYVTCVLAFGWLMARFTTRSVGLLVVYGVSVLFPLHMFYTIPQSYPVEFIWTITCMFLALGFVDSALIEGSKRQLVIGTLLFFLSLNGQEYNLVLSPVLLFATVGYRVWKNQRLVPWRELRWLFGSVVAYAVLFIANYVYQRFVLNKQSVHLSVSFDVVDWAYALFRHFRASMVPVGLFDGIRIITLLPPQGITFAPSFTYASFFSGSQDWLSMAVVFAWAAMCWLLLFLRVSLTKYQALLIGLFGLLLAFVPAGVVTSSALYQKMFQTNYVSGHITTFHMNLGMTLIGIALGGWLKQLHVQRYLSVAILVFCVLGGATIQTIIFRYNASNRQMMNYGMQRWEALHLLGAYNRLTQAHTTPMTFLTDTYQTRVGVAGAPSISGGQSSYWSKYVAKVVGVPVTLIFDKGGKLDNRPRFEYSAMESGHPLGYILRPCSEPTCVEVIVLSAMARDVAVQMEAHTIRHISSSEWACSSICVYRTKLPSEDAIPVPIPVRVLRQTSLLQQVYDAAFGKFTLNFGMLIP